MCVYGKESRHAASPVKSHEKTSRRLPTQMQSSSSYDVSTSIALADASSHREQQRPPSKCIAKAHLSLTAPQASRPLLSVRRYVCLLSMNCNAMNPIVLPSSFLHSGKPFTHPAASSPRPQPSVGKNSLPLVLPPSLPPVLPSSPTRPSFTSPPPFRTSSRLTQRFVHSLPPSLPFSPNEPPPLLYPPRQKPTCASPDPSFFPQSPPPP